MIDETDVQTRLAANLRRLRIARHLSLSEIARATGISKATLSGIENGRANPTIETLAGLAAALRVSLAELLEELPVPEMRIVRAAGPRDGAPLRRVDALESGAPVEVSELLLSAGQSREVTAGARGSRVHMYVLEGKVIAGPVARSSELGKGDYAAFPGDVPHLYETARQAARVLLLWQGGRAAG